MDGYTRIEHVQWATFSKGQGLHAALGHTGSDMTVTPTLCSSTRCSERARISNAAGNSARDWADLVWDDRSNGLGRFRARLEQPERDYVADVGDEPGPQL